MNLKRAVLDKDENSKTKFIVSDSKKKYKL